MTRATSRPGRGLRLCIRLFEMQRHDSFVVVVAVVVVVVVVDDGYYDDHDGGVVISLYFSF